MRQSSLGRNQSLRISRWVEFLVLAFGLHVFNGYGYDFSPKLIADGTSYVACSGVGHVNSDGGLFGGVATYSISFTNDILVKGVHDITITSIATVIKRSLHTYPPYPKTDTNRNVKPFDVIVTSA